MAFNIEEDSLLSIKYLKFLHPELNNKKLKSLLTFCRQHTISHKECYGDGSIMFLMWTESIKLKNNR